MGLGYFLGSDCARIGSSFSERKQVIELRSLPGLAVDIGAREVGRGYLVVWKLPRRAGCVVWLAVTYYRLPTKAIAAGWLFVKFLVFVNCCN